MDVHVALFRSLDSQSKSSLVMCGGLVTAPNACGLQRFCGNTVGGFGFTLDRRYKDSGGMHIFDRLAKQYSITSIYIDRNFKVGARSKKGAAPDYLTS